MNQSLLLNSSKHMTKLTPLLLSLLLALPCIAEPAPEAPKEFSALELVTGLHTHFDEDLKFEFRIIEIEGSSSVALNPIYLYFVASNLLPGDKLQSRMVTLPQVSEIKRVRFKDERNVVYIDAMIERSNEDGTKTLTRPVTIVITPAIQEGKLPQNIDVVVKDLGEE